VLKQVATMTLNHVSVTRVATSVEKGPLPASTFEAAVRVHEELSLRGRGAAITSPVPWGR